MLSDGTKEKLILNLLGLESQVEGEAIHSHLIGKVCMLRTYSAGVHFGELVAKDGQTCLLKNSRRVHCWVEACSLSQLSQEGSKDFSGCRIAMVVPEILLEQVIEVIPMPESVVKQFMEVPEWKS